MENHELEKNFIAFTMKRCTYFYYITRWNHDWIYIIYRGGLPSSGSGLEKSWVSYSKFSICEKDSGKFWYFDRLHNIKVDKKK